MEKLRRNEIIGENSDLSNLKDEAKEMYFNWIHAGHMDEFEGDDWCYDLMVSWYVYYANHYTKKTNIYTVINNWRKTLSSFAYGPVEYEKTYTGYRKRVIGKDTYALIDFIIFSEDEKERKIQKEKDEKLYRESLIKAKAKYSQKPKKENKNCCGCGSDDDKWERKRIIGGGSYMTYDGKYVGDIPLNVR